LKKKEKKKRKSSDNLIFYSEKITKISVLKKKTNYYF